MYADVYATATDPDSTLRKQVAVAGHKAAVDVDAEDEGVPNHDRRYAWARGILDDPNGPVKFSGYAIWAVLENAVIAANPETSTDQDVQFTVNSLVDRFAGAES